MNKTNMEYNPTITNMTSNELFDYLESLTCNDWFLNLVYEKWKEDKLIIEDVRHVLKIME